MEHLKGAGLVATKVILKAEMKELLLADLSACWKEQLMVGLWGLLKEYLSVVRSGKHLVVSLAFLRVAGTAENSGN
jgi:hypothetical protein